jgi:hypothetical protein
VPVFVPVLIIAVSTAALSAVIVLANLDLVVIRFWEDQTRLAYEKHERRHGRQPVSAAAMPWTTPAPRTTPAPWTMQAPWTTPAPPPQPGTAWTMHAPPPPGSESIPPWVAGLSQSVPGTTPRLADVIDAPAGPRSFVDLSEGERWLASMATYRPPNIPSEHGRMMDTAPSTPGADEPLINLPGQWVMVGPGKLEKLAASH